MHSRNVSAYDAVPEKNVRFIAVNDSVDSGSVGGDNDFTPLWNLFNMRLYGTQS